MLHQSLINKKFSITKQNADFLHLKKKIKNDYNFQISDACKDSLAEPGVCFIFHGFHNL